MRPSRYLNGGVEIRLFLLGENELSPTKDIACAILVQDVSVKVRNTVITLTPAGESDELVVEATMFGPGI